MLTITDFEDENGKLSRFTNEEDKKKSRKSLNLINQDADNEVK